MKKQRLNDSHFLEVLEIIHFGFRNLVSKPDLLLEREGLSRVHHRLLFFIHKLGQPSVGELLKSLKVTKQAVNRPLRQLLDLKFIEMVPDLEDQRVKLITMTAKGNKLQLALTGLQTEFMAKIAQEVGPQDWHGWKETMKVISQKGYSDKVMGGF